MSSAVNEVGSADEARTFKTSTFGNKGTPGASVYSASKHAVEGLTRCAALEAAEFGVRVNVVSPGPIETGMVNRFAGSAERKAGMAAAVPFKRLGRPEEIAQMIVFVASDRASFSTGATFSAGWQSGAVVYSSFSL